MNVEINLLKAKQDYINY